MEIAKAMMHTIKDNIEASFETRGFSQKDEVNYKNIFGLVHRWSYSWV